MSRLADNVKKISYFMGNELENIYYYRYFFNHSQQRIMKEHSIVVDKDYEKEVKLYYKTVSNGKFKLNPMWHSFYASLNGIYDKRYIPENLYFGKLEPFFNRKELAKAIDDKCFYDLRLNNDICNIPKIYVRNVNGVYLDSKFQLMTRKEAIGKVRDLKEFIIKPSMTGKGGAGVFLVSCEEYSESEIEKIIKEYDKDFVVQEVVQQSGKLHEINKSSVNTIRIMSMIHNDEVKILSSMLRVGSAGSKVDNICSGGMFCGITEDGYTKSIGYSKNFEKYEKHPNGNSFANIKVPNWDRVIEIVKEQHGYLAHFKILSWDIAVSENEISIIEFNVTPQGMGKLQLCNGPLFGEITEEVLGLYFNRK